MNPSSNRSRTSRVATGAFALALLGAPALVGAPVSAAGPPDAVARPDSGARCISGTGTPSRWRAGHDTPDVSAAVKARVDRELQAQLSSTARSSADPLPAEIHVPVQIHVIHGRHRGDRNVSRTVARRLFYTLRAGFNGRQNPEMTPTGIIFELNKITITRNDRWFHASPSSRADKQMRRTLHRGKRRVLNVYLNDEKAGGQALLGYARFPWLAGGYPLLDGVIINVQSLPGGRAHGYNLGDTIIHETGHWLGLFHTFEGGCDAPGDYVADTAAAGEPSFSCPLTRDTCPTELPPGWVEGNPVPDPVFDPVTNFMDYSFDTCMNNFTPGQRTRMVASFMRFRYGR